VILYEVFAKGYEKRNKSINCTHRIFVFQPFDFERTRNASRSCALNLISTFFFHRRSQKCWYELRCSGRSINQFLLH